MFGLFKKKAEAVVSPVAGTLVALSSVADPVFSSGAVGPGFAIEPSEGVFRSPIAGEVALIADTLHAYAIRSASGAEVLVHIGMDSVKLLGEGFTALAKVGDAVKVGDPIIGVDLEFLKENAPAITTPVVITNHAEYRCSDADLSAAAGTAVVSLERL